MRAGDVIGHEFMGEVVEVGPEVKRLSKGDRVVVPSFIVCGSVGLMAQKSAFLLGVERVIAIDRVPERLRLSTDRAHALRQAIMACRKGGKLSILGVYGVMDKFPMGVLMNKGLTVRAAQQHGQRYVPRLIELASRGELDPSFLITHRFSLEDASEGNALFKNKQDGCVRVTFAP